MKKKFVIECHFKGCDGKIDVLDEIATETYTAGNNPRLPWLVHTICCPKCSNPVGDFNIGPSYWVNMENDKDVSLRLRCPDGKLHNKRIKWKGDKWRTLNPYLKPWARNYRTYNKKKGGKK